MYNISTCRIPTVHPDVNSSTALIKFYPYTVIYTQWRFSFQLQLAQGFSRFPRGFLSAAAVSVFE